jgi:hypothetical protein
MTPGKTRQPPASRRHALTTAPPGGVPGDTRTNPASVPPGTSRATARSADAAPPAGAPAVLADRDELAAWLADNWGTLADAPAELLDQIES